MIDTIMLSQNPDPKAALRVQTNLNETLKQTVEYCEGDKEHPFLEECISVFANYFENSGSYDNSLVMWAKMLRIQQNLLGEDREEMIPTYKKMAALAVAIQQPNLSQKYLQCAEDIMKKVKAAQPTGVEQTDKQKRTELEDRSQFVHQQYIAANQATNWEKAYTLLVEQESLLTQLNDGKKDSKVCSNMFLRSQLEMRTGRFEESLETIGQASTLLESTRKEFGQDYEVIKSKFHLQAANTHYILRNFVDCLEQSTRGLEQANKTQLREPGIARVMANVRRDLINLQIRSQARVQNVKASELRKTNVAYLAQQEKYKQVQSQRDLYLKQNLAGMMAAANASDAMLREDELKDDKKAE